MGRRGLGKGLAALIPEAEEASGEGVVEIEVEKIRPNRYQPRKAFDEAKLEELAESIRSHGVVQPIVVRLIGDAYELVAGERRWRAAVKAGIKKIPAVVREMSDSELLEVALIENLQRTDLNPMEEAEAYRKLASEFGLSQEEIAKRVGKSRSQVANTLRLLQLPPRVQESIRRGELSMGHAKALLGLERQQDILALCEDVVRKGLSVRETEEAVRRLGRRKGREDKRYEPCSGVPEGTESEGLEAVAWRRSVESALAERLGTRVRVVGSPVRGKVEISYFSAEDLERVLELVGCTSAAE